MRAYFFHLAFELYPTDFESGKKKTKNAVFVPPPGTDIFGGSLPIHSVASWGGPPAILHRSSHRRTKTDPASTQREKVSKLGSKGSVWVKDHREDSNQQNRLPSKPTKELPSSRDWRFDSVSISSIDMSVQQPDEQRRSVGKSMSHGKHQDTLQGGPATRGRYIPSDPKNTEIGCGVVHLYRDVDETPGLYDDVSNSDLEKRTSQLGSGESQNCTTLCILAVPSYMTPADLLGYVGEQTREDVSHFRLIRTDQANKYMVLMKFRDAKKAKLWQKEWNGKTFNSMEVGIQN
jgi:BRCA1-associated protein